MFPCVCPVIDHRCAKNIFNTLGCISSRPTFLFLPHFDVIRDLLLNRRMATWNVLANIDGECDETYLLKKSSGNSSYLRVLSTTCFPFVFLWLLPRYRRQSPIRY